MEEASCYGQQTPSRGLVRQVYTTLEFLQVWRNGWFPEYLPFFNLHPKDSALFAFLTPVLARIEAIKPLDGVSPNSIKRANFPHKFPIREECKRNVNMQEIRYDTYTAFPKLFGVYWRGKV